MDPKVPSFARCRRKRGRWQGLRGNCEITSDLKWMQSGCHLVVSINAEPPNGWFKMENSIMENPKWMFSKMLVLLCFFCEGGWFTPKKTQQCLTLWCSKSWTPSQRLSDVLPTRPIAVRPLHQKHGADEPLSCRSHPVTMGFPGFLVFLSVFHPFWMFFFGYPYFRKAPYNWQETSMH